MRAQEIDEMRGLEISFCGSWGRGRPRAGGGVVVDCNPMARNSTGVHVSSTTTWKHGGSLPELSASSLCFAFVRDSINPSRRRLPARTGAHVWKNVPCIWWLPSS